MCICVFILDYQYSLFALFSFSISHLKVTNILFMLLSNSTCDYEYVLYDPFNIQWIFRFKEFRYKEICYKESIGTAETRFSLWVYSLKRKFCYKEIMNTANMIPYKRILTAIDLYWLLYCYELIVRLKKMREPISGEYKTINEQMPTPDKTPCKLIEIWTELHQSKVLLA